MKRPTFHTPERYIRVWDIPTRIFHWALALSLAGAMITQEMESLRLIHITFGYTMIGLVGFRLVWGFIGTRYARFSSFVPYPGTLLSYARNLITGHPKHYLGHNPAGAIAIFLMLGIIIGVTASGILMDIGIAEDAFEDLHEGLANLLLMVVLVHIAGVFVSGKMHHENLISAMIHGRKPGPDSAGITSNFVWIGVIMIALITLLWVLQLFPG